MKQLCFGGPGTWTLHTVIAPARLGGGRLVPSTEHFFTREEALAARATWRERHAGNPDAVASVTAWQPDKAGKKGSSNTKPKGRR